jgi:hypothetical protein
MSQSIHEFASEASRARDEKAKKDEKTTVWVFVWTLFVFKVATVIAILWAAGGSGEAQVMVGGTSVIWIGFPIFAMSGPTVYFIRRRLIRRRRRELLRSEWMLNEAIASDPDDLRQPPVGQTIEPNHIGG